MPKDKSTIFFLLLGAALLSCGAVKNYPSPEGPEFKGAYVTEAPAFRDTIEVVSYNIKFGRKIDEAIEELKRRRVRRKPDILLLQEMDAEGVEKIAEEFAYNYIYYPASMHTKHEQDFGNAILSLWPIRNGRKIILPHESPLRGQRRIAVSATVEIGEYEVLAYSVHTETFWLSHDKRIEQVDSIAASIPPEADHVIVAGDFNTSFRKNIDEIEEIFERVGLIRASAGVGPTAEEGPFGIIDVELDHIFTRGMTVLERAVSEKTKASDHWPLWTVLKIKR
jgi:endonuclease/exonuclease/phosphatase family metal-dependent hydrolase